MCLSILPVCALHAYLTLRRSGEGVKSPEPRVTECGSWEPSLDLQKQ